MCPLHSLAVTLAIQRASLFGQLPELVPLAAATSMLDPGASLLSAEPKFLQPAVMSTVKPFEDAMSSTETVLGRRNRGPET